jgi:hypothetical protein
MPGTIKPEMYKYYWLCFSPFFDSWFPPAENAISQALAMLFYQTSGLMQHVEKSDLSQILSVRFDGSDNFREL